APLPDHPLWGAEYEDMLVQFKSLAVNIISFYILVLYGLLVPNTWQRCAIACLITLAIPPPLFWTALPSHHEELFFKLATGNVATLVLDSGLAIFGSYKMSSLQQEVKLARQQ